MAKITKEFSYLSRGPAPEHIFNRSQMVQSDAYKYARFVCADVLGLDGTVKGEISGRIKQADPKSLDSIRRKARDNYDGDTTRIKDGARLTIFTETPEEMEKVLKTFGDKFKARSFNKDMQGRGYTFRENPHDFVTNPKRWGYMAVYMNIEHDGTTFEVQIYPRSMKEAYTKTHELYELARESGNLERWEQACNKTLAKGGKMPNMDDFMTQGEIFLLQETLDLHREAAQKAGLMKFVDSFPVLGSLPSMVKEPDIAPYPQDIKHPHKARPQRHAEDAPVYDA